MHACMHTYRRLAVKSLVNIWTDRGWTKVKEGRTSGGRHGETNVQTDEGHTCRQITGNVKSFQNTHVFTLFLNSGEFSKKSLNKLPKQFSGVEGLKFISA